MREAIRVQLVEQGSVRALVSIKFGEIEIRGFRVMRSKGGGLWVASPSRETVREGKREFEDFVHFETKEAKKAFRDRVVETYRAELDTKAAERETDK